MKARVVGYGRCLKEPCNRDAISQALCEHQQEEAEVTKEANDLHSYQDEVAEDTWLNPAEEDALLEDSHHIDDDLDDDDLSDMDYDFPDEGEDWPIERQLDCVSARVVDEDSLDSIYDIEEIFMARQYRSRRRYNNTTA